MSGQLDANQRVAANIRRLRLQQGLTQLEAAQRAHNFIDRPYSKASWSLLERSIDNGRVKRFDARELEGFARLFEVEVAELLREIELCSHCEGTGLKPKAD